MRTRRVVTLSLPALLLVGCAGTKPIAVAPEFWELKGKSVGIVMAPSPVGGAYKAGSQGLLDVAISSAMAKGIDRYLQGIELYAFDVVQDSLAAGLEARGFSVRAFPDRKDVAALPQCDDCKAKGKGFYQKDLSPITAGQGLDYLLIVQVLRFGTIRSYYGFIPLSAPQALVDANGVLVDLQTHRKVWEQPIQRVVKVEGPWDQPPEYPNLTKAIKAAMDGARAEVLRSLF